MRRLEYTQGKPSKHRFWELDIDGHVYTVRHGSLGGRGEIEIETRTHGSATSAASEAKAKLKAKLRKGYVEVSPAIVPAPIRASASNVDLEAPLVANSMANIDDRDAWAVYADWLQANHDPCGEWIALNLRLSDVEPTPKPELEARLAALESACAADLARLRRRNDVRTSAQFEEVHGLVTRVTITIDTDAWHGLAPAELLAALVHAPIGRLLTEIRFVAQADDHRSLVEACVSALGLGPTLPHLRRVSIELTEACWGHSAVRIGDLGGLLRAAPTLERLHVAGDRIRLAALAHPCLRELVLETSALPVETARAIGDAELPACVRMVVYFGASELESACDLGALRRLLTGAGVPKLVHLGLVNAEFGDLLASTIAASELLVQLETLDLSLGTMLDPGAEDIVATTAEFAHLRVLDLRGNFFSAAACESLATALPAAVVTEQRNAYEAGFSPYYVSVGE